MSTRGITSAINIIELESKLEKVVGTFDYIGYSGTERSKVEVYEGDITQLEADDDRRLLPLKRRTNGNLYPDRWVTIKIKATGAGPDTPPSDEADGPYVQNLLNQDGKSAFFEDYITDSDGNSILQSRTKDYWKQTKDSPNVFFTQDFVQGYVRITPNENQSEQTLSKIVTDQITADSSIYTKTALNYLKNNLSGSSYISVDLNEYEKSIKSGSTDTVIVLDPNTNLPISETDFQASSSSKDTYINSHYLDKIVSRSYSSPMVWSLTDRDVKFAALITDQLSDQKYSRKLSSMKHLLSSTGTENKPKATLIGLLKDYNDPTQSHYLTDTELEHWGWHAVKSVLTDGSWSYVSSFIVDTSIQETHEIYPGASDLGVNNSSDNYYVFKDPYVLYGKTYKYEIRDAWIIKQKDNGVSSTELSCSFLLGTQTTVIEVDCQERLPPLTPSSFSFQYVGENSIRIEWLRNKRFVIPQFTWDGQLNGTEFEANDVGGYLLFIRNSLLESYELHTQFHITKKYFTPFAKDENDEWYLDSNNTSEIDMSSVSPSIIGASIPNDKIEYIIDSSVQSYDFEIRSNTDYYVTMCTYDVHGNISNYSEQFFLRRNNVTGEVQTSLVSSKGASLAYPNAMIPTKFVLSSLKVSGYSHMNIYQTPDTTSAYPTNGDVSIQLIDLNTENAVVITGTKTDVQ